MNLTTKKPTTKRRKVEYEPQPTLLQLQSESRHLPFEDSPYFENLVTIRRDTPKIFALFTDGLHKAVDYYIAAMLAGNRLIDLPPLVRKKQTKQTDKSDEQTGETN